MSTYHNYIMPNVFLITLVVSQTDAERQHIVTLW